MSNATKRKCVTNILYNNDKRKKSTSRIKEKDNRVMKTFLVLPSTDYMKVIVFGCQVIGLQMNLYAMDVLTPEIYRFRIIDKVSFPA
ncbi:hypothetical protein RclHR1_03820010 [Rhizophagus clarus]|uniref:Uncharacterized protein n=1 Tax=Rhizophagus clarus TaxID=94130 RepID=A0A2Z6RQ80_9GLOM|nr:hypothetical protein RclHR1_03820010 [Rhizophagus clarus]GET01631.1 hypothetical protein RCL_jg11175.t1 [Rhizophagus clarus]